MLCGEHLLQCEEPKRPFSLYSSTLNKCPLTTGTQGPLIPVEEHPELGRTWLGVRTSGGSWAWRESCAALSSPPFFLPRSHQDYQWACLQSWDIQQWGSLFLYLPRCPGLYLCTPVHASFPIKSWFCFLPSSLWKIYMSLKSVFLCPGSRNTYLNTNGLDLMDWTDAPALWISSQLCQRGNLPSEASGGSQNGNRWEELSRVGKQWTSHLLCFLICGVCWMKDLSTTTSSWPRRKL